MSDELDRKLEEMARRDEKVHEAVREERPDLLTHAKQNRAGYDLLEYVRTSLVQMRENTSGRIGLLQDAAIYVLYGGTGPLKDKIKKESP